MKGWQWLLAAMLVWGSVSAETQLAAGSPQVAGGTVGLPFFLFSTDGITAGQFDLAVPDGWTVGRVEADPRFRVSHDLDAGILGGGSLRVVFYSMTNTPVTGATLGKVFLRPPSGAPPLPPLGFLNPLFADPSGAAFGLSGGFPALQILAHPQPVQVATGQQAQLSVAVVGIDPVYQWYQGAKGQADAPVGTGSGVLLTAAMTETASFWVRVSDSFGTILESNPATVTVSGAASITLTPNFAQVPATSGSGTFAVGTLAGSPWAAATGSGWVTLSGASGSGNGTVTYAYRANPGLTLRTATITVGGVDFTLTQRAAVSPFAAVTPMPGDRNGWKQVPDFGWLTDSNFPYVYHRDHGWLYFHHDGPGDTFHIYSLASNFGWMRTGTGYADGDGNWIYAYGFDSYMFFLPEGRPGQRTFYNPAEARWIRFP